MPNDGQTDESVRYHAQGGGFSFYFTPDKAVLAFQKGERGQALHLRFLGANPNAELQATDRARSKVNYLTGQDRHANLPTYHALTYRELWPGIDMVFRGEGGKLKYEFRLRPGADPGDIRLAYRGADGLSLGAGGALLIDTPLGSLRDSRPTSYQRVDSRRVPVESRHAITGGSYGFALGRYDRSGPLVIDPGLDYSTYLGGSGGNGVGGAADEVGRGIAVDALGAAYITGQTPSTDFPTTPGAFDTTHSGAYDVFVTKLNASGSALVYSTYLGGTSLLFDFGGGGIAVDDGGSAYVTGVTNSSSFPTTPGAFDTTFDGPYDAFVTKLNASGSALVYSTYLGGSDGTDIGNSIVVDAADQTYVTGLTNSTDFPTESAFQTFGGGSSADAFVTKLNASGSALVYSTYLGGEGSTDVGQSIAVDVAGQTYVTGRTSSTDFPTTPGSFDTTLGGGTDAFVTSLHPSGSALVYSTYLGGSGGIGGGSDEGFGIAVDSLGAAYVTGFTNTAAFPTTPGAFDTTYGVSFDAFVTKLNASGSALVYSTYLGGSDFQRGTSIAVDAAGAAHVTGETGTDFPTTPGAFDTSPNGSGDAFATKLNASGSALDYSTYLGGSSVERGLGIAVADGRAYITGFTISMNFPTTAGAFDTSQNGGTFDPFVTKLDPTADDSDPPTSSATSPAQTSSGSFTVDYNASDGAGSGLASVALYAKVPGAATYTQVASDPSPGASGAFPYTAADGHGRYSFYTRATDSAGNVEAAPQDADTTTDFVITASGQGSASTGSDPTAAEPVHSTVTAPDPETEITITEAPTGESPPAGFAFLDWQVEITVSQAASAADPIRLEFLLDHSLIEGQTCAGQPCDETTLTILRDEVALPECPGAATVTSPPACVSGRAKVDPDCTASCDVKLTILTTDASTWNFAAASFACAGKPATIVGTNSKEALTGTAADDVIVALGGNDTVLGGGGGDTLCAGAGNDRLDGGPGADLVSGQADTDTASYAGRTSGVTVTLAGGANDGNSQDGPAGARDNVRPDTENVTGGAGADTLTGSAAANVLDGRDGADAQSGLGGIDTATYAVRTSGVTVTPTGVANDGNSQDGPAGARDNVKPDVENVIGGSGADTLSGNAANNRLEGRNGPDIMNGLGGLDTATYAGRAAGVSADPDGVGDDGNSQDGPAGARDNIKPDVENLIGGAGADTLSGNATANRLTGGSGADSLFGLAGNDALFASDGIADTTIDCDGGGADSAHVDAQDPAPVGCESVGS